MEALLTELVVKYQEEYKNTSNSNDLVQMKLILHKEKELLDNWIYQLNTQVVTHKTPLNKIQEFINQSENESWKLHLKSPQFKSYLEKSIQLKEKILLNQFTVQKNDVFSNKVYRASLSLINNNGRAAYTLEMVKNNYKGLLPFQYAPLFVYDTISIPKPKQIEQVVSKKKMVTKQIAAKALLVKTEQQKPIEIKKLDKLPESIAFSHLIFVMDVSRSMHEDHKLPLLKSSLKNAISKMRKEDKLSLILYSNNASVLVEGVSFQDEEIEKALDQLYSSGISNVNKGLQAAYEIANKHYIPNGNNRIILATDGDVDFSKTMESTILKKNNDTFLSVFAFGTINESKIKTLKNISEKGNGNFYQVTKDNNEAILMNEILQQN